MRKLLLIAIIAASAIGMLASEQPIVSFVNFYPGPDIYELEGHSALRIRRGEADIAISYGMFDFNAPHFVYRFVKGETDYMVGQIPWQPFMLSYLRQDRRIVEHVLDLDSAQTARLIALVADNLQPENRTYRYNYVKDNCATRPLRTVQLAIGDSIQLAKPTVQAPDASTFREVMAFYHRNYPWYQFGIDLALGSGIDYPISNREKAFAPIVLDEQIATATVDGKPLVNDTIVLNPGKDATMGPTPWLLRPTTVCWALFLLLAWATARDLRRRCVTRWIDATLFGIFGIAGLLLTFLIFVSVHEATSPNWLYLWLNPMCLVVSVCIWLKNCNMVVISYQFLNFALLIALTIACILGAQSLNAAFYPLIACDLMRCVSYLYVTIQTRQNSIASR